MIPRSIDVQKFIQQVFTTEEFELYGGILGSVEKSGWTNRSSSYYTEVPPNAYDTVPGDQAPEYWVSGYSVLDGSPLWSQPARYVDLIGANGEVFSVRVPIAASPIPPPIGPLIPPTPPEPEIFTVVTTPETAYPGTSVYSNVTIDNPQFPSETLYWKYSGVGLQPSYFTNGALSGTITTAGSTGGFTSIVKWPIPTTTFVKLSIYRDATLTRLLASDTFTVKPSVYAVSSNKSTVGDDDTFTITVDTQYAPSGGVLFYRFEGVPADYFVGGQLEGQFTLGAAQGQFSATMASNLTSSDSITVRIFQDGARTNAVGNPVVIAVDGSPSYTLTTDPTSLSESQQVVNQVATRNVAVGTTLYWAYEGVASEFFVGGALQGSAKVSNVGTATFDSTIASNLLGDANVLVKVFSDAARTIQVGNSTTFTITKTIYPTYTLSSSPKTVTQNNTLTNTLSTTNVPDGTSLYWQYAGAGLDSSFFTDNKLSGNITVNGNGANWSSTLISDVPTTVNMTVKLYPNSLRLQQLAVQSVTVQKTPDPTYNLSVSPTIVTDGRTFTSSLFTTEVQDGTVLYWDYTGPELSGAWFADNRVAGQITVQQSKASWSSTVANPVPSGIDVAINLYTDVDRNNKVKTVSLRINKTPVTTYSWVVAPTQLTDGSTFKFTVTASSAPTADERLYYRLTGILANYLDPTSPGQDGYFILPAGQTQVISPTFQIANPVPASATMQASLYNDASRQTQIVPVLTIPIVKTPIPTYAVTIAPSPAVAGNTITSTVQTTELPQGTTVFWKYTGTNVSPLFFTNGLVQGSVIVDAQGSASWSSTLKDPLPQDATVIVNIFSDGGYTKLVASKGVAVSNLAPTYSLVTQPSQIKDGDTVTNTVTTTHVADNTPLYWEYTSATGISPSFFKDGRINGNLVVKNQTATWSSTLKPYVAGDETMMVSLYADSNKAVPVGNTTDVDLIFEPLPPGYSLTTDFPVAPAGAAIDFTLHFPEPVTGIGKTFYWAMEGLDLGDPLFIDDITEGSVFANSGQSSVTVTKTLRSEIPYGTIGQFRFSSSEGGQDPYTLPSVVNIAPAPLEQGVYLNTAGIHDGDAVSIRIEDSNRSNSTIHWVMSGSATADFFSGNTLEGSVLIGTNGSGTFDIRTVSPLPNTDLHDVTLTFYSDAAHLSPIYNIEGYHFFVRQTAGSSPYFRAGADLLQYYNLGGYWDDASGTPGPNNIGTNPDLNMHEVLEVNTDIDELLLRVRAVYQTGSKRLWNLDALQSTAGQFMGTTTLGSGWNINSGNEWGKNGNVEGPTKAKNCCYHAKNTFKPHRFIVSIGGDEGEGNDIYNQGALLAGFNEVVNGTPTEIQHAAYDAASLVQAAGATGLEISLWFDRNETLDPVKYNAFFTEVRSALNQLDTTYTLHLAVNARRDDGTADTGNQAVFVGTVHDNFNTVTIKNYNLLSKYGQNPESMTGVYAPFYHPSNLYWSLREINDYFANGVPVDKVGISASGQGRLTLENPENTAIATYSEIIRGINAASQPKNDAVLGRFTGSVTASGTPVSGQWGFDSAALLCQKAQSAINLGLSNVTLWDFSSDYYNATNNDLSAIESASRSNDALIRAIRKALSAGVFATDIFLVSSPYELKENNTLTNTAKVTAGTSGGKTFWYQYETLVKNPSTGADEWQAIDPTYFVGGVIKESFEFTFNEKTWSRQVNNAVPGDLNMRVAIYQDEPPATIPLDLIPLAISEVVIRKTLAPTFNVQCAPTAVNDGGKFTTTITGVNVQAGTEVYWFFRGTGVTGDYFAGGVTQGTVQLNSALQATFETKMANILPGDATIEVDISPTATGPVAAKALVTAHKVTPDVPEYAFTTNRFWAFPGESLTFEVNHLNPAPHNPIYWKIEGFESNQFLTDNTTAGTINFTGSTGSFTLNLKSTLANGCVWKASIYTDAARTNLAAPPLSGTFLQTKANVEPFVTVNPPAVNVHQAFTYAIYDPDSTTATKVYVKATGTAIDQQLINEASEAELTFDANGFAYWELTTVPNFPTGEAFYGITINAYSSAGHTSQYKNIVPQYVSLHEVETISAPTLGAYAFMSDWVAAGSYNPTGTPASETLPSVLNVNSYGLNQLDEFYFVGEVRPWTDGKLYHCPDNETPVITDLILNGNGTGWGTQDVGPIEKLLHGWFPLKTNIQSIYDYTPPKSLVLTVGGPSFGDKLPDIGSSDSASIEFANQVYTLAGLCEASAVDIQYVPPSGTLFTPHNMVRLFQRLRQKFLAANSAAKIYFSTYPTNATDTNRIADTCNQIAQYVDRINIITTQQFSQYGQDYIDIPGQPGGIVWAHTGVYQCVQDMARFIAAGVSPKKLGMAFAYYGHAAIVDFNYDRQNKFTYSQSLQSSLGGIASGDLPLGHYLRTIGATPNVPVSLDTTTTLAQKVQSLRNMGITHLFGMEITKDYWAAGGANDAGGNARVGMALTRAAKIAITGAENPDVAATYEVTCVPGSVSDGQTFTGNIATTGLVSGTEIYWSLTGTNVTADMFSGGQTTGNVAVNASGAASFTVKMANVLPNSATITVSIFTAPGGAVRATTQVVATKTSPPQVTYGLTVDKAWAMQDDDVEIGIFDTTSNNANNGSTVWWKITGIDVGTFFTDGTSEGSVTLNAGKASVSKTVKNGLPNGCVYKVSLYSDSLFLDLLATTSSVIVQGTTGLGGSENSFTEVSPSAAGPSNVITWRTSGKVLNGTVDLHLSGSAVDAGIITTDLDVAVLTDGNGNGYHQWVLPNNFPTQNQTYHLTISATRPTQGKLGLTAVPLDNDTQVTLHEAIPNQSLKYVAQADIRSWVAAGAIGETAQTLPDYNSIKSHGIPALDDFRIFGEITIYSDGKLYFTSSNTYDTNSAILSPTGTAWNPNDTNPQEGPNLLKRVSEQIETDITGKNYTVVVGGYQLSNYIAAIGANNTLTSTLGSQLNNLLVTTKADKLVIDYEPLDAQDQAVALVPSALANICQYLKQNEPEFYSAGKKLEIMLPPSLTATDDLKRVATAVACKAHVDGINIKTYDNPSSYGQPTLNNALFSNHTGVAQSVLDIQRFIDAGVPGSLLKMGIATYGRLETNPFSNDGESVDYLFGVNGNPGGDWPLGRLKTLTGTWYSLDTISTITQKVVAARNLGLAGVFSWDITQDFYTTDLGAPAGNTRALMAQTRATRLAISGQTPV